MRIIFSRKGFDGVAGGWPSPIVKGHPFSFPIPGDPSNITYGDLRNKTGQLLEGLTKISKSTHCHLDPDIDKAALLRRAGWRGAFGQGGPAQGHLRNQGVTVGDLFVFWGWFKRVEKQNGDWKYVGEDEHRIFGWLQIGDILTVRGHSDSASARRKFPWLKDHPHMKPPYSQSNTIYVAKPTLRINGRNLGPGWGVFKNGLRLTMIGSPRSHWQVPDWLNPKCGGVGMSGSCNPLSSRWHSGGYLNVGPGQEFVANVQDNLPVAWLRKLFKGVRPSKR